MHYILRIPANGHTEAVAVSAGAVAAEETSALLHTDVTERMRIPVMPEGIEPDCVLCYLIDARDGDKELPANFIGTFAQMHLSLPERPAKALRSPRRSTARSSALQWK